MCACVCVCQSVCVCVCVCSATTASLPASQQRVVDGHAGGSANGVTSARGLGC